MRTITTQSQKRDYMQRKHEMLKQMMNIGDSYAHYLQLHKNTPLGQLIEDIYCGRPYHVPLNECCYEGTNKIDWDRAQENLSILTNKLLVIRELCK